VPKALNFRSFGFRLALATLVVAGLEAWQLGHPSLWADEVATIAASTRSLHHLLSMLGVIDAVHGTYYLFMHFYIKVAGISAFALRLPSALAVAASAGVMACIAKRQFGERLAWFTLIITATLPRLLWAATEARSYGIDALLSALLLLLLLLALDASGRRRRWLWVAYTFTLALGIHFFIYLILVAFAHGIWIFATRRTAFRTWLLSLGIAFAVSAYILTIVIIEKGQVGWLPAIGVSTVNEVLVGQAFWGNVNLAYIANGLIIAVLAGARFRGHSATPEQTRLIGLLALIIALPPVAIIGYSLVESSIYDSRYLTMTAPMVGLTLALAVDWLFSRRVAWLALLLILLLAYPSYGKFRATDAKGTHWSTVASAIGAMSRPGDGILFTDYARKSPSQSRIMIAYPAQTKNLTDITVKIPYFKASGLYPHRVTAAAAASRFGSFKRILVLEESTEQKQYAEVLAVLTQQGFKLVERKPVVRSWIDIFEPVTK
jgi:mannosyltransferase